MIWKNPSIFSLRLDDLREAAESTTLSLSPLKSGTHPAPWEDIPHLLNALHALVEESAEAVHVFNAPESAEVACVSAKAARLLLDILKALTLIEPTCGPLFPEIYELPLHIWGEDAILCPEKAAKSLLRTLVQEKDDPWALQHSELLPTRESTLISAGASFRVSGDTVVPILYQETTHTKA